MSIKKLVLLFVIVSALSLSFGVMTTFATTTLDVDFDTKTFTSPVQTYLSYWAPAGNVSAEYTEPDGNKCAKLEIYTEAASEWSNQSIINNGRATHNLGLTGRVKISFDVKAEFPSTSPTQVQALRVSLHGGEGVMLNYRDNKIYNATGGATNINLDYTFKKDVWQHVEFEFFIDSAQPTAGMNIYIDGKKVNNNLLTVTYTRGATGLDLGRIDANGLNPSIYYLDNIKMYRVDKVQIQGLASKDEVINGIINDSSVGNNYQWQISEDNVSFANILGETGITYVIKPGDSGKYLRFTVSDGATTTATSSIGPIVTKLTQGLPSGAFTTGPSHFWDPITLAFDGDNTTFARVNVNAFPRWLQIDFGKVIAFNAVKIVEQRGAIGEYDIMVSDTGAEGSWSTIKRTKNNFSWTDVPYTYTDQLPNVLRGRYVRFVIVSRASGYTHGFSLHELEFISPSDLVIGNAMLSDTNNVSTTKLYGNKSLTAKMGLNNMSAETKKVILIAASYTNNVMTGVIMGDVVTIPSGNSTLIQTPSNLTIPEDVSGTQVKLFLWDDVNGPYMRNLRYTVKGTN